MRVSLCNEVVRQMPVEKQAEHAAALGYDGLEIAPFTLNPEQPHRLGVSEIRHTRKAADDAGISISGLHWLLLAPEGLSITTNDPTIAALTRDVISRLVDHCAALGGSYLVHGSPKQRMLEPGQEDAGRARALEMFSFAASRAEEAGVTYCLEALYSETPAYVSTLAEAATIVKDVNSPAFGSMIDCAAAGLGETESIPKLLDQNLPGGLIRHVHFNDPNRRGPGEGELSFAPIMASLKRNDYRGWIGVEPFIYQPDGPACSARAIGYIRALQECLR